MMARACTLEPSTRVSQMAMATKFSSSSNSMSAKEEQSTLSFATMKEISGMASGTVKADNTSAMAQNMWATSIEVAIMVMAYS